jgi:nucleoside-diphosphate-sugar epimerase
MRIFVAGGTGAIGKCLVPRLRADGHEVVVLARNADQARRIEADGNGAAVTDPLDRARLTAAVVASKPEVVLHELTALGNATGNFKRFDEEFALTNRFRTEVTDTLLGAARAAGARRFIAQSFCGWPFAREGGPIKSEEDPLDPTPPAGFRSTLAAIRHVEDAVSSARDIDALALRYGLLYGPGTGISRDGPLAAMVRGRRFPIVGAGGGVWSFVQVDDAAAATAAAVSRGAPGIYNVVDGEPARVTEWLPFLADVLHAKPPRRIPAWLARPLIGDAGVSMMTQIRGGSNTKAMRELGWTLAHPTWRRGFVEAFG